MARRGSRTIERALRRQALTRDLWTCQSCGFVDRSGALLDADHIIRLVDGGAHSVENIQTLCRPCHRRKTHAESLRGFTAR